MQGKNLFKKTAQMKWAILSLLSDEFRDPTQTQDGDMRDKRHRSQSQTFAQCFSCHILLHYASNNIIY